WQARIAAVGGEWESIGIAEARSALAWWLEAGVDVALQEQPRDWLKAVAKPQAKVAPTPAAAPNIAQPAHETLAELQDWLASSAPGLPATIFGSRNRNGCCCSAMARPRRCSASRCRWREVMSTRSKGCGRLPPSIRAS